MAKGKGNKKVLASINYSIDTVKKIKDNYKFTIEEKQDILHKFVGTSPDNNSYFTPDVICNWIKQLLDIQSGKVADLSAGVGSMIKPLVEKYGSLQDGITFEAYEFDTNNSAAGEIAWSDYSQVNYIGDFNSIEQHEEIPDDYLYIVGNPPFSGSIPYWCEWNHAKNGKAKNNNICDAFVDLSVRKVKDKGFIALVLPYGHLYKGNATAKLRQWMKSQVALKGVFPLDQDTFAKAGINGTTVGTCLVIWQKGVAQEEVFFGELCDKDDIVKEMESMARQFQLFLSGDYEVKYLSDSASRLRGKVEQKIKPWTGEAI
ncbi:N-6 DNA methylase [Virgibacillus sp. SK37]|uniref:N-6 DNA methylase n=1 Tax=Virgibacillus sp. SK37 TaxID=403957 RepID=UPI0004D1296E|nr:N-6 DNA methylase [Virgibacillus sp. SK37]AIF45413.1 hypothetical protein X953_10040 [Virgibacillus sp. SK37]